MANIQIVINAINKASGDLLKVKADVEGVGKAGKTASGGTESLFSSLSKGISTAAIAAAAVAGVGLAVKDPCGPHAGKKNGVRFD